MSENLIQTDELPSPWVTDAGERIAYGSDRPFFLHITVEERHIDPQQHVNNAVHVPESDVGGPPPLPPEIPAEAPAAAEAVAAPVSEPEPERVQAVPVAATPLPETPPGNSANLGADEEDEYETFHRQPREEEELDMTPMVDVTFLLLIFFMVTASFSLQKSIHDAAVSRPTRPASPLKSKIEEDPEELDRG